MCAGAHTGQKRASDSLELESEATVRCEDEEAASGPLEEEQELLATGPSAGPGTTGGF